MGELVVQSRLRAREPARAEARPREGGGPRGTVMRMGAAWLAALVLLALLPSSSMAFGFLTKWGSGGTGDGQFGMSAGPEGIAPGVGGNIYVVDRGNSRVEVFSPTGAYLTQWGSFGTGDGQFNTPFGLAVGPTGDVYVVDTGNFRVEKFNSAGAFIAAWGWGVSTGAAQFEKCISSCRAGLDGTGDGQFHSPTGVAVSAAGSVYVIGDG